MNTQVKRASLVALNIAGVIATIVVNALAVILPLNGKDTGKLSDQYPNLFVPAGLTFSIWGVIYILLIVFSVYQIVILLRNKAAEKTAIEKMGIFFFIACCANVGWIFSWHYEILWLSIIIMIVLLLSLIASYLRLGIGAKNKDASAGEKYCIHLPTSVYLGWISVATIANITAFLVSIRWDGFGLSEEIWAIAVIVAAIALGLIMIFSKGDIFYALVVDWALLGILLKRLADNPSSVMAEIVTVIVGLAVISLGVIVQIIRRKVY
jgi:hypothetical protein